MVSLVFNLFVAHIIADFYLQWDCFCQKKRDEHFPWWWNLLHALIVGCISWLCVFSLSAWWLALSIAVTHLLVDVCKSGVENKIGEENRYMVWVFVVDQLIHLLVLVGLAYFWSQCNEWQQIAIINGNTIQYVVCLLVALVVHKPSNILVNYIIQYYEVRNEKSNNAVKEEDNYGSFHSGALIGTMERLLIIVLVTLNKFEAIGFLIAAKSILRFNDVKDSEKSEYVVAGTFLSFAIALCLGILMLKCDVILPLLVGE